jgi:hypothetical protein
MTCHPAGPSATSVCRTGGAELHGLDDLSLAAFCCDHDDWHRFPFFRLLQLREQLQPIHIWHIDIRQDQVDVAIVQCLERFHAISRFQNLPNRNVSLSENSHQDFPNRRGVIYD